MAEEEMRRLPNARQKLSGKKIVTGQNSEKTERRRRRKPDRGVMLSGKRIQRRKAKILCVFFVVTVQGG
jgi:hypothetical protein